MAPSRTDPKIRRLDHGKIGIDELDLKARIGEVLNRHPAVGLAVGVIRDGRLEFFYGHGLADIAKDTPITQDTVFRIGSITKTFTAIAVLQLWEQGWIDLDAPAKDYLRSYKLIPANAGHQPPTVRQLLTHTAGLPQCAYLSRAYKPVLGEMVKFGERVPTLTEFYRGELHLVAEPSTTHTYSSHGFATLGQIIEDVTGEPLGSYFRDHIFDPLGMEETDLVRSDRVKHHLATGYALRSRGARPVGDCDLIPVAAGGVYSTTRDIARYVAALIGGGTNENGTILKPETLASMFAPQYQPDPRLPGVGLAFFRHDVAGHLVIEHEGLMPGFSSELCVAPTDGLGIVAFTNGARGAKAWLGADMTGLLRHVLGVPDEVIRPDVPHHPEIWSDLCGWYSFRGSFRDVERWVIAGAEISVRRGSLILRPETPIPALRRGLRLHPDHDTDPYVFRIDLSDVGIGTPRVIFSREPGGGTKAFHLDIAPMLSFDKQPAASNPRRWATGALGAVAVATAVKAVGRRRQRQGVPT